MSLPLVGAMTAVKHELCQGENTKCKSCSIECLEQNAAMSAHLWSQGHEMRAYLACPTHPCIHLWVRIQKEIICEYSCATNSCMCYVWTKPKLYQSQVITKKKKGGGVVHLWDIAFPECNVTSWSILFLNDLNLDVWMACDRNLTKDTYCDDEHKHNPSKCPWEMEEKHCRYRHIMCQ